MSHAGNEMNPGSKLLRWVKVIVVGCALGLCLVAADMAVWSLLVRAGHPGHAHPGPPLLLSTEPVKQELARVIDSQLSDFRRDDYAGAYAYADSDLQAQVSTNAFERIVKTGYPAIAQSRSASFGVILDNGQEAVVTVGIISQSGHVMHYRYLLRHEHGGWRISGVFRVPIQGRTI
jgi:Domain of unknown function (DUF4864)